MMRQIIHDYLAPLLLISIIISCQQSTITQQSAPLKLPKPDSSITFFFCGDIMLHSPQIRGAYNSQSDDYHFLPCFQYMIPFWLDADFSIANLETTLGHDQFSGYPRFRAPWQIARDLQQAGINTLVLANNHCCDQGAKGIRQTLYYLDSLKIKHTGISKDSLNHPLYLKKNNFKIALLNYTYGTNGLPIPQEFRISLLDTNHILKDIQQCKEDHATHLIAFIHWGNEYEHTPSTNQRRLAKWLYYHGISIIIGSHPHVVQPIKPFLQENDTTGIIVYSLGNFISNQTFPGTDGGICVKITLKQTCDNKTHYTIKTLKCYTYKPYENGVRQYYVIPESAPDSIVKGSSKIQRDRFFNQTDSILQQ